MRDRVHEMRLAEPDAAVEEERVVGAGRRFGDGAGRGVRELVRGADDEGVEGEARVQRSSGVAGAGAGSRRASRRQDGPAPETRARNGWRAPASRPPRASWREQRPRGAPRSSRRRRGWGPPRSGWATRDRPSKATWRVGANQVFSSFGSSLSSRLLRIESQIPSSKSPGYPQAFPQLWKASAAQGREYIARLERPRRRPASSLTSPLPSPLEIPPSL